jgi:flagellum-specific peptidoglycan hydrolase FlgJ
MLTGLVALSDTPQNEYIKKYASIAVSEMHRSGVPASITLAQGMLESRYGLSSLAADGNNHFGIKCHRNWKGKTMRVNDDAPNECFRVYKSAEESFRDHSDFLRYQDRYKALFELKPTDYKGWAYGLKKAGYATDPGYPDKLIRYIEENKLYEYDRMTTGQAEESVAGKAVTKPSGKDSGKVKSVKKKSGKAARSGRKSRKSSKAAPKAEAIPESPLSLEAPRTVDRSSLEKFKFSLSRPVYTRNGVPYVLSIEGETYSSIAKSYDLFLKEILKFNDLVSEEPLAPGTIVYIQAKKKQSEKGLDMHIVDEDSGSLRDICQRFGVRMESVRKLNGLSRDYEPREGDTILLWGRKKKV